MVKKVEPYKGISVIYDEIRPSYPEALIQDIVTKGNMKLSDRLLEIGAGTGKATMQFAEKGFSIHVIEPDKDMAEILMDKCVNFSKVSLEVSSFEEWSCSNYKKYDVIYCAQAFHWLDTNIKYKKCYELLEDNGYLVLFWYNPCDFESEEKKEIEQRVEEIIEKYTTSNTYKKGKLERRTHSGVSNQDERKAEIEISGLFEVVEHIEYLHEINNNAQQYIKARKSVPVFASILDGLEEETIKKMDNEIEEVINDHGGYISTLFKYSLYITKKINQD